MRGRGAPGSKDPAPAFVNACLAKWGLARKMRLLVVGLMPPLLDSEDALARSRAAAPPTERERIDAELALVSERAAAVDASPEQRRLAEALVLALARRTRAEP